MTRAARHLKRHRHSDYNKKMEPDVPKVTANKLPLPLIIIGILVILGAVFAYYLIQQKNQSKPIVSPPSPSAINTLPPLPARFLGCPLSESLCKSTDFYSTRIKDSSFSATLKENTPLLAVFDGTTESMQLSRPLPNGKKEDFTILTIVNQKQKLVAEYYFKGKAIGKKEVREGEVIATSSGQPLNFLEGKSFVFVVLGLTEKGDSGLEPLEATHFK